MDWKEYIEKAKVTESHIEQLNINEDFLIAALRLNNFSAEVLDAIKKLAFYNNPKKLEEQIDQLLKDVHLELELLQTYRGNPEICLYGGEAPKPDVNTRIAHSLIGLITEAGELSEAFEKGILSGKFDEVNLKEEFFDMDWYKAIGTDELGIGWDEGWQNNIDKLMARYNGSYSDQAATNRNIELERGVLENE